MLLTASRIHNGYGWLPAGTVLEVADDGRIIALHDSSREQEAIHYDGVLCPGFVNVHCHMELSHMRSIIPERTGLIPFLQQVMMQRENFTDEQKQAARHIAYEEMLGNGIVAVGDIANSTDTLDLRALDKLHVHTFIEAIGFTETHAQQRFDFSKKVFDDFVTQSLKTKTLTQSIVPHAPYSISPSLFGLINDFDQNALISIHNEESIEENKFYTDKSGAVNDLLNGFNIDSSFFTPSGRSSLQTYTEWFSASHPFIFVHNTYSTIEDVRYAQQKFPGTYWCLCPNANKYIENRLPDIDMLLMEAKNICIGTDSLASNQRLSVLAELYTIKRQYAGLDWGLLLRWGTFNGARALQHSRIGSIEPGNIPGIVQVTGLDNSAEQPSAKRII